MKILCRKTLQVKRVKMNQQTHYKKSKVAVQLVVIKDMM